MEPDYQSEHKSSPNQVLSKHQNRHMFIHPQTGVVYKKCKTFDTPSKNQHIYNTLAPQLHELRN